MKYKKAVKKLSKGKIGIDYREVKDDVKMQKLLNDAFPKDDSLLEDYLGVGYCKNPIEAGEWMYCSKDFFKDTDFSTVKKWITLNDIEFESESPKDWYCKVTEDNLELCREWQGLQSDWNELIIGDGHILLSKHISDGSYYFANYYFNTHYKNCYKSYQEITTDQLQKIVNEMKESDKELLVIGFDLSGMVGHSISFALDASEKCFLPKDYTFSIKETPQGQQLIAKKK